MVSKFRFGACVALAIAAGLTGLSISHAHEAPGQQATAAQERQLFAIILKPGPNWKPGKPFVEQGLGPHFRYLKALVERGEIFAAGGLGDDHGLILLYASDQAGAEVVLANDPAVLQGTFVGEARPYGVSLLSKQPLAVKER